MLSNVDDAQPTHVLPDKPAADQFGRHKGIPYRQRHQSMLRSKLAILMLVALVSGVVLA
jgi:hypothetical protein